MSKFFNKTLSFLGLAEDEIADFEEESISGEDTEIRPKHEKHDDNRRSSGKGLFKGGKVTSLDTVRDGKKTRVFILQPDDFEDVQRIGDSFKGNIPVIINLQDATQDLSKRVIDFCSGLSYALGGSIKRVADKVFLLTPENVEVTSGDREILENCDIYNQY